jgi:RNA polymerase sigma-70 factor (ECF subfamily)
VSAGTRLQEQALDVHQRLLNGDPTAPLDAVELLLDPVVARLRAKWPGPEFLEACHDVAVEVLVGYLQAPARYEPARSALLTWLTMQAHADLINAYRSPQQTFEREWLVESALAGDDVETEAAPALGDRLPYSDLVPSLEASAVLATVRDAFPDKRDRQLIWLICVENVHTTDEAAAVLGLIDLDPAERAAAVKRHKDRVMRRLRRLGLDNRDE